MKNSDFLKQGMIFVSTEGEKILQRDCTNCGAPLTVHQGFGTGVCDQPQCRAALIAQVGSDKLKRDKAEKKKMQADVEQQYTRAIDKKLQQIGAINPESVLIAHLPKQPKTCVPLSDQRREAFSNYLHNIVGEVYDTHPNVDTSTSKTALSDEPTATNTEGSEPDNASENKGQHTIIPEQRLQAESEGHNVLKSACDTCKGYCCRNGGDQAFLTGADIRRWQVRNPLATAEQAHSAYLSLLPTEATESACVFQGSGGCTLPREMRSDHCNNYLCDAIKEMIRNLHDSSNGEVVFVAHSFGQAVSIAGWSPKSGYIDS